MRALSQVSGVDAKVIAHRMAGDWQPTPENYATLISQEDSAFDVSKPYPFFLAHAVEGGAAELSAALGDVSQWQAEWKWDGIRGQLVKRQDAVFLWSRGEELISEQFPEIIDAGVALPDCVLDGEVLPARDGQVLPFSSLQKRLGRKNPGKKYWPTRRRFSWPMTCWSSTASTGANVRCTSAATNCMSWCTRFRWWSIAKKSCSSPISCGHPRGPRWRSHANKAASVAPKA